MAKKSIKLPFIGLIAILLIAVGALAVFAQDEPAPDEPPVRPGTPFGRGGFHFEFHGRDFGHEDDQALADALGITLQELQAARQKVAADRLAQAVEDGRITQEQADLMLATQALKGALDQQAILAEALGISVDELQAARADGSLRDLLANITPADLRERMQAAVESALQQAVADNVITQEQADLLLDHMGNGMGFGGQFGGHHGFGRGDFRGFGGPRLGMPGQAFGPSPNFQFRPAPAFGA
jgi:hypothetical protein